MAGFRLAPRAARARRNPWQRRRLWFSSSRLARSADDQFYFSDGTGVGPFAFYTLSLNKTVSDSFSISDAGVGASPSAGTATGGLIFLFSQGTSGSAYTRSASDGFTIADAVASSYAPAATSLFSRSCGDSVSLSDVVSGSVVSLGADATLVGVDLEFTALLDVELVFTGE